MPDGSMRWRFCTATVRAWRDRTPPPKLGAEHPAFLAARAREESQHHEKNADQRHAARRAARGHRRWTDAVRHRHRATLQGTEEVQHLQGPDHPARGLARGRLRRVRCRQARLPAAEGNFPRLLRRGRESEQGHDQGAPARRPGSGRAGGQGGARQQGRGTHHLHLAGRALPGADAQQSECRRGVAPHRGRRPRRAQGGAGPHVDSRRHGRHHPHRRRRPRRGRAAVGRRLPAAGVEGHHRRGAVQARPLPDLPGVAPDHPRAARLPARRRRRDPHRQPGNVR